MEKRSWRQFHEALWRRAQPQNFLSAFIGGHSKILNADPRMAFRHTLTRYAMGKCFVFVLAMKSIMKSRRWTPMNADGNPELGASLECGRLSRSTDSRGAKRNIFFALCCFCSMPVS